MQVNRQIQWWEDEVDLYWVLLILSINIEVLHLRVGKEDGEVRELSKKEEVYNIVLGRWNIVGNREGDERSQAVRILDVEVAKNPNGYCGICKAPPNLTSVLYP